MTPRRTSARVDRLITQCGANLWDGDGHPSDEAIFVIGLPRAGSTLLEQILASHSQVEATAELPFIGRIIGEMVAGRARADEPLYPHILNKLRVEERVAMGQQYLDLAAGYRTGKSRFIDKLPNNWEHVALIKDHPAQRHHYRCAAPSHGGVFSPTSSSCSRGAKSLPTRWRISVVTYADYLRLMDPWHSVFPRGLLTVQYEDVVEDLDTQVKQLLSPCQAGF